jgi:HEAT repeats
MRIRLILVVKGDRPLGYSKTKALIQQASDRISGHFRATGFEPVSERESDFTYTLRCEYYPGGVNPGGNADYTCSLMTADGQSVLTTYGLYGWSGELHDGFIAHLVSAYLLNDPTSLLLMLISNDSLLATSAPRLISDFMATATLSPTIESSVIKALLTVMPLTSSPDDYVDILTPSVIATLSPEERKAVSYVGNTRDSGFPHALRSSNCAAAIASIVGDGRIGASSLRLIAEALHDTFWVAQSDAAQSFQSTLGFPPKPRSGGIWCLGEIGDPACLATLVEIAKSDKDDQVRRTAHEAVGKITRKRPGVVETIIRKLTEG